MRIGDVIDHTSITPPRLMSAINSMIEDCPLCKNLILTEVETIKTQDKVVTLKLIFSTSDSSLSDQNEVSILIGWNPDKEHIAKLGDTE